MAMHAVRPRGAHVPHAVHGATLRRAALTLLGAYGVVCVVLPFLDGSLPAGIVDLGVAALAGVAAGVYAPRATAFVLVLSGAVVGPLVALAARLSDAGFPQAIGTALLVVLLAVPALAGLLLLAGTRDDLG